MSESWREKLNNYRADPCGWAPASYKIHRLVDALVARAEKAEAEVERLRESLSNLVRAVGCRTDYEAQQVIGFYPAMYEMQRKAEAEVERLREHVVRLLAQCDAVSGYLDPHPFCECGGREDRAVQDESGNVYECQWCGEQHAARAALNGGQ